MVMQAAADMYVGTTSANAKHASLPAGDQVFKYGREAHTIEPERPARKV